MACLAVLAALCAAASGCGTARGDDAPAGLLAELARELPSAPAIAPRLSISGPRPACIPPETLASESLRTPCAASGAGVGSARIARISARAAQGARASSDVDAMRAAALIDLLFESGEGKSLQRSISSLRTAARLAERPAPVLADLAAAYIVRAERSGTPRDLAAAIEAADEAVERDPRNHAARYNLALALERLELLGEAAQGWRDYLATDSTSAWADEARRHLRQVLAVRTEPPPPAAGAPLSAYAAYAAAEPQRARELGWCRVLGAWGAAVLAGDTAGAEGHLRRAEAMGAALEARPGGDATLADGVRSLRHAQGGTRAWSGLAAGHREFAAGCELERRVDPGQAEPHFAAAAAADGSPTLRVWARLFQATTIYLHGDTAGAAAIIRPIAQATDSARHPAVAARAAMLLSSMSTRGDDSEAALRHATRARALYAGAGERELEGSVLETMFAAHARMGDPDAGYALAYQGLLRLRPYRASYRLHNLLGFIARVLGEDGFPRAAVRVQNEDVRVAERNGRAVYVSEARLARARLLGVRGARTKAGQDVAEARAALAGLPDPTIYRFLVSRRQIAEASAGLRSDPAGAAERLDSAAAYFMDSMHSPMLAFPPMVDAAHAWLAAGDVARAADRLEAALTVLEQRRDRIHMEPRRAGSFEEARTLVDQMTLLRLAADRPDEALEYLDRGRASLAPVGAAAAAGPARRISAPPGEVAVAYALVADTLLAWTVQGTRVQVARAVVDTALLVRTIEHVRRQMEAAAPEAELRPHLARLYQWLVLPVEGRLGGAETPLVVMADGDLGAVPFPALYDARRRRYLVEDHTLRMAASLGEAARPARRPAAAPAALFVADPAFDGRAFPGFARLPQAAEEARQIAGGYPGARMLAGPQASGSALRDALGRAGVVHYAGHAVFDDGRPERSYLILAPTPGAAAAATLQAGEIAEMDLHQLSLVVLSACQTVRTGPGRAAGFSGLAGAFLAAGAGGAVGSLWEVDDRLTRPLMVELHRAYRGSGDGPGALRAAQLHLLHSGDPALRSPAAWAAFRYAGR